MSTVKKNAILTLFLKIKPQEAVLVLITMIWGGTFLAVHQAMLVSGPFFFVGLRFATATLALVLFSLRSLGDDLVRNQGRGIYRHRYHGRLRPANHGPANHHQ